jgi:prolipoprotein diacylglyceryltransferase
VPIHLIFDLLAAMAASLMTLAVWRWRLSGQVGARMERLGTGYAVALALGAVLGAYVLGTANLWLTGLPGIGRSILGAFAGAILAIEIWKRAHHVTGSTGALFVAGFATSVAVGRIGCYLAGLPDNTYGTPTTLPWAHDFGDRIPRHPVQLYESAGMALFLAGFLIALARTPSTAAARGFYWLVTWYAGLRFLTEFLKPYARVIGPFDIFQIVCLGLLVYAALMLKAPAHVRT